MTQQRIARLGDSVTASCSIHGSTSGTFDQASTKAFANGIRICLVGHGGSLACGHRFVTTAGSSMMDVDGVKVVRVGDPIQVTAGASGSGTITSGSPTVDSN